MVRTEMRELRRGLTTRSGAGTMNFPPPPADDMPSPLPEEGVCLHVASGTPRFQYKVPQSLYGTVMFMPLLVHETTWTERLRWHGLSYFWMTVNYVSQVAFLVGIHYATRLSNYREVPDEECEQHQPWLLAAALFVCFTAVLTDVQETFDLAYLLTHCVPTVPETTMLRFKRNWREMKIELVGGGFSARRKNTIRMLILFPKLVMAVALQVVVCRFLIQSETNMDIVLNATALVFVIETPESIFAFFSLPEVRTIMAALPDFDAEEMQMAHLRPLFPLAKFALAMGFVVAIVEWDYDFDRCVRSTPRG